MLALLLILLTQVPCSGQELSPACYCKQGMVSACEVVRQTDPALADRLEAAYQLTLKVEESTREAAEAHQAQAQSSCDASAEPAECKGQWHHPISKTIFEELENHKNLRGQYKARDPRFVTRAVDEQAHCGYQSWHRNVDKEVVEWLRKHTQATRQEFESFLRDIYKRTEMRARFPHGF